MKKRNILNIDNTYYNFCDFVSGLNKRKILKWFLKWLKQYLKVKKMKLS